MSFSFRRITLRNWLVYEGEVVLDFGEPAAGRNIHVVYGMNGFGKTSLLRAIQWAFHKEMPGGSNLSKCFNEQALAKGIGELSVAIEFQYNGIRYRLVRRATTRIEQGRAIGHPNVTVDLAENDHLKKAGIDDIISRILPRECQQFFFFDGLEIEKYARQTNDAAVLDAIERVLGIPEVRNLESDLSRLAGDLERERDRMFRGQAEYNKLRNEKIDIETDVAAAKDTLDSLRKKREDLVQLLERLELRAAQLESVREKQERLSDLRRQKADLDQRLDSYGEELKKKVNVVTRRMVLPLLKQRQVALSTSINRAERASTRLNNAKARETVIQEILADLNCICGQPLDKGMQDHLQQQLEDLQAEVAQAQRSQEKTGSIRDTTSESAQLGALISSIEREESANDIQRSLLTKYSLEVEREEIAQELAELAKELEEHEDTDVRSVYVTLAERQAERNSLDEQIKTAEGDYAEAQLRLEKLQQQLNTLGLKLPSENRVVPTLQATQAAQKVAGQLVNQLVVLRRASIEQKLTSVFRMITNKKQEYDVIQLGSDYVPQVVTKLGRIVQSDQLSAGEKEVLAFSFIAGLNLSTESGAPLVMDTPFGHLDVRHREGLIHALPDLPCQVVLLATDRDIPPQDLSTLEPWLGGVYEITRDEVEERSLINKTV